jgi:hypothetical protein
MLAALAVPMTEEGVEFVIDIIQLCTDTKPSAVPRTEP